MSGILTRFFERRATSGGNINSAKIIEMLRGGYDSATGIHVSEESSLRSTAVFACVRVLSETLASLPLITYRRMPRGKSRAPDFYLYSKLHDAPNPEMTSFTFRSMLTGHEALWGNGYAEIEMDGAGRMLNLWPLLPHQTAPVRASDGALMYRTYVPGKGTFVLPAYRVFHVKTFTLDGMSGVSMIGMARRAVELSLATEEFGARYFGNGANPSVVLKHPGQLSEGAYERMTESWMAAHSGLSQSHRAAILEEGTDIEKIGIPPEDSQFLETRKFQATEIARLYRIPPHMIGDLDRATFSNIEQQSLEFVIYTMMPWFRGWEQEIARSLLLERERQTYFAEFLVDSLLRGDTPSRYGAYQNAIQTGWMTRNEARERENMNVDDPALDKYLVPLNMQQLGSSPIAAEAEQRIRGIDGSEGQAPEEGQAQGLPRRIGGTGEAVQEWPNLYEGNGKR